jgi:hypothetical protein
MGDPVQISIFHADYITNMTAIDSSCLWLANLRKSSWKPFDLIDWFGFMVLKATFNNISVILWLSVLLVEETGVFGENHRPVASHWQTLAPKLIEIC